MIEQAPQLSQNTQSEALKLLENPEYDGLFTKMQDEYVYWDKAKYYSPAGVDPVVFWQAIKLKRNFNLVYLRFGKLKFHFTITGKMQQLLHEFDMNFGGTLSANNIIPEKDHGVYLVSSIMEEAIASSQMEGASTTRKIAKDMLRKQARPINKSQQMIVNNYTTIQYLVNHKSDILSIPYLLNIHKLISNNTLDRSSDEGAFRKDDNIYVMNDITGEIVHTPPSATDLENLLSALCDFVNDNRSEPFVHPIIKGIIVHFMLAYFHPFVDGNGRTSRSLVYWYLLKNGYWLTEYLSISRVIYRSKSQYEKSFLYVEADDLDLSYFINYNLNAMKIAYEDLQKYLVRKQREQEAIYAFRGGVLNDRQLQIVRLYKENPQILLTAKELSTRFLVTMKTARSDLQYLVQLKLVQESPVNKRMMGYIRAKDFDVVFNNLPHS